MQEFRNVIKDIKSGALPFGEIPGFVWWLIGRRVIALVIALAALAVWTRKKK